MEQLSGIEERHIGRLSEWNPTGCIALKHMNDVISELTRFRFPTNCDDENIAACFGLEIARPLHVSFRDFQMARYETGVAW